MKGPTPWQPRSKWLEIGQRIADACTARRVGYSELAEKLDVSPSLISKWLHGDGCPTEAFADLLYHHLTINQPYLVSGEGPVQDEIFEIVQGSELKRRQAEGAQKAADAKRRLAEQRAAAQERYQQHKAALAEAKEKRSKARLEADGLAYRLKQEALRMAAVRAELFGKHCFYCGGTPRVPNTRICLKCFLGDE